MSSSPAVAVEVEHGDRLVLVRVRGELDFGTTPQLLAALGGQPPDGASLVLDLSDVEFCDSSALGAMIAMHKAAQARGGRFYLTGAHPQVRAAIAVTSLDRVLRLRPDLPAVRAELATG
jgi:anti-sigma B factor antagonist